jgi:hypothetical protein
MAGPVLSFACPVLSLVGYVLLLANPLFSSFCLTQFMADPVLSLTVPSWSRLVPGYFFPLLCLSYTVPDRSCLAFIFLPCFFLSMAGPVLYRASGSALPLLCLLCFRLVLSCHLLACPLLLLSCALMVFRYLADLVLSPTSSDLSLAGPVTLTGLSVLFLVSCPKLILCSRMVQYPRLRR